MTSIIFIKRGPVLEGDKGLSAQLCMINLSDGSPYETLHDYVSNAVAPFFKSYIKETGKAERDGDKMAQNVEKKIAELEMGMLHLQQNIDIPDINLAINPIVSAVIKNCQEEDRKAKVEDFGDRVEDAQFLNRLQSGVNLWIREIQKLLGTRRLMCIMYDDFEKVLSSCSTVFITWDDECEKFTRQLRELVKKKRDDYMRTVWRVNTAHKRLQARLDHMRKFRHQHEQLLQAITRVLRLSSWMDSILSASDEQDVKTKPVFDEAADANAIEEVNLAYEYVKEIDVLDVSKDGSNMWEAAIKRYDERIARVETRITAHLCDQLGTARNANEMFWIFSRFNALFVRPHIRGAIREYQTQLMQRVKDDIESLHEKFKVQHPQSKSWLISRAQDFPPVSSSVIWARQIEEQLNEYMQRVEDVLGKGWESHIEGQKLKNDGDSFRIKLSTKVLFDDWIRKVQNKQITLSGNVFAVLSQRGSTKSTLCLGVNFQTEIIELIKEDLEDLQHNFVKLKAFNDDDKTETAILRSRVDEQSKLIMILMQRADEEIIHAQTLDNVNQNMIACKEQADDELKLEMRKSSQLENRFHSLSSNHDEMIKIKDEYKHVNKQLREVNVRLKTENSELFSKELLEKDNHIQDLQERFAVVEQDNKRLNMKFR